MNGLTTVWHCYIEQYESVQRVNVIAATAELAAVEAARATGQAGRWTVVHGTAVEVDIDEKRDFVVKVPS